MKPSLLLLLQLRFSKFFHICSRIKSFKIALYRLLSLFIISCEILFGAQCRADAWNDLRMHGLPPGTYGIMSGTGFFIHDGYIVTNAHVVQNCLTISVRSAVAPSAAHVVAEDKDMDLALLHTENLPKGDATLRQNAGLKAGDLVFVIGYPLDHGQTGDYLLVQTAITHFFYGNFGHGGTLANKQDGEHPATEYIFIDGAVDHGNSGGPLIDKNGNVIGVVVAETSLPWAPKKEVGVAIGIRRVEKFLEEHHINYNAHTSNNLITEYHPDQVANKYLVNIQCVRK